MKKFIFENKNLVILWILCGAALFIFCGHYGNILTDIGREIYYPEQILQGKVLYKDLFNIYGPFSYLFNALLYKIFSPNLGTLYFSGVLCSFAIVSGIYLIARKFLSEFLSVSLSLFTIISGVCAAHLFNYTLPYSYAMLYGTVGFIYSLFALIKYGETQKTYFLYISALLGGLCVSNKYDFFIYGFLLFLIAIFSKNKKIILNFITCFIAVPVLCGLVLFIQGLEITDCTKAFNDVYALISSKTLKYFYIVQGVFFQKEIFKVWGINILKTLGCFGLLLGGVKLIDINKILGWSSIILASIILYFAASPLIFVFMVPFTVITAICLSKKLLNNILIIYLILGVLSVTGKSFWVLLFLNYGNYVVPLVLLTFLAVIFSTVDKKYEKAFAIGLIVISLNTLVAFAHSRIIFNQKISTNKGVIYSSARNAQTTNTLIKKLKENNIHSAVVYPEGLIINFMADIKADNYYNSMLPLYVESMGEDRIIAGIKNFNPEVIILTNASMKEYGFDYICDNYAFDLKDYIIANYDSAEDIIADKFHYMVFKRKDKDLEK